MKTFLDRLFVYFHKAAKPRIAGKPAIILITMNQKNLPQETKMVYNTFKVLFRHIGIYIEELFCFSEIMQAGDILRMPDYLESIRELAQRFKGTSGERHAASN